MKRGGGGGGLTDLLSGRGAADRGLCGWQTPTKREGRGGAGHWQNAWASFWALWAPVTVVISHPAPFTHTHTHTHIHPLTPSQACSQLRGLVSLVLARQWCNHSTARHYRVCAQLSNDVRSRDGGVCSWKDLSSNSELFFYVFFFSTDGINLNKQTFFALSGPTFERGLSSLLRQIITFNVKPLLT